MTQPVFDCEQEVREAAVVPSLKADTKRGVIEELVDALVRKGRLAEAQREAAIGVVMEREAKMSTGMQYGVAVPHGKLTDFQGLVSAIGLKPDGIEFAALDGQPSRIFVLVVSRPRPTCSTWLPWGGR